MANLVPADGFNRCLLSVHWHRFVLWRVLPMLGAGQEYRLLMQPVLMSPISTGSSNKWFLWPGSLACFLVVHVLILCYLYSLMLVFDMDEYQLKSSGQLISKVFWLNSVVCALSLHILCWKAQQQLACLIWVDYLTLYLRTATSLELPSLIWLRRHCWLTAGSYCRTR